MASTVIKNWDKKTWLSSKDYIKKFNSFLVKNIKLNSNSEILDIGCGRGKILGSLSSKLKLKNKPLGIDLINHKDKDKRIKFKKINALNFFLTNKKKFDLIIIKQTIHLFQLNEIKKFLDLSKKNLTSKGKIFIFSLDINKNEIPTFKLMKNKELSKEEAIALSFSNRACIKNGDSLSNSEMVELVNRLFGTNEPFICPNGNAILIQMSLNEIENKFNRK